MHDWKGSIQVDINEFESTGMLGDFPESVRRLLELESLDSIVEASQAKGATRLFSCPSFEPIEALTLVFFDDRVLLSHAVSGDDAWERIALGDELAKDSSSTQSDRAVPIRELPELLQDWQRVGEAIDGAESCMSDNPDGIPYYHAAFGAGVDSLQAWFNPTEAANPLQFAILAGYAQIKDLL